MIDEEKVMCEWTLCIEVGLQEVKKKEKKKRLCEKMSKLEI